MILHFIFVQKQGSITRTLGAVGGDTFNDRFLLLFTILMTSMNCLSIFDYRLTLSSRGDIFDGIHLMANIFTTVLALILVILIRTGRKADQTSLNESIYGPKPIIIIDICDDEPEPSPTRSVSSLPF